MSATAATAVSPAALSEDIAARRRTMLLAWVLLLPMLLVNLAAFVFPMLRLGEISFLESHSGGVLTDIFTWGNYVELFTDPFYLSLIGNSIGMSLGVTLLTLVLSYPIALFLYRAPARWRNLLFIITISPLLVSAVVRTYGFMVLLGDQGLVNSMLLGLGVIDAPLRMVNNYFGAVVGLVEILMPYMALALIAGFGRLNVFYEEAAASLGANAMVRFWRVILPLTLPGVALGSLLCFVLAISAFVTPKLLGGGRVFLLATEIYDQAIVQLQWPMAAATSMIVLLIFGVTLVFYSRIVRRLG
jgi:putative spermidine/putrescine transport system permease protein